MVLFWSPLHSSFEIYRTKMVQLYANSLAHHPRKQPLTLVQTINWWFHLPQPPAAPLSRHRYAYMKLSAPQEVCVFALRPTAWTLWHDLQLKQSILAERKREPSHKNSSRLPFTWSMAIYCIFFGIFIITTCYQTNSSGRYKESCSGNVKMLYLPYTAKVNSTLLCLKKIQALFLFR